MADPTPPSGSFLSGLLKDWGLALAAALGAWLLWSRLFSAQPVHGPAPDFTLPDASGGAPVTLSALGDGPVVLNFWFTSCPPCRAEIPELAKFHSAHPEVPLYGVSVDETSPGRLWAMSQKLGINYTVLHDADFHVSQSYGVDLFPTTLVIHHGSVEQVHQGQITVERLERLIAD